MKEQIKLEHAKSIETKKSDEKIKNEYIISAINDARKFNAATMNICIKLIRNLQN